MSDDDWDFDEPVAKAAPASAPAPTFPPKPVQNKWAGEDADDDDWDVSDTETKKKEVAKPKAAAAPIKKKMTLKQKLQEKERLAAEARKNGNADDILIDERTEQDRRREAREKELEADLAVAADLMGDVEIGTGEALKAAVSAKPKTKDDFAELSRNIIAALIATHQDNALYPAFAEQLAKDLCDPLTAVQTRKVSSALGVVGNTKQAEEREKASGKKKGSNKPKLAAAKVVSKSHDLEAYDDFDDDDFM